MWQAVMDWLPDLRVGTFELRDLASVIVGGLGAYLAFLAIRMGQEQARTAKRQTEIAETQFLIQSVQLGRQAEIGVEFDIPFDDFSEVAITITNLGVAPISITEWKLYFPPEADNYSLQVLDAQTREALELAPRKIFRQKRVLNVRRAKGARVINLQPDAKERVVLVVLRSDGDPEGEGIRLEDNEFEVHWRLKTAHKEFKSEIAKCAMSLPLDIFPKR